MNNRIGISIIVGIVALTFGFASGIFARSSVSQDTGEQLVATRDFGTWQYEASKMGEYYYVQILNQEQDYIRLEDLLSKTRKQGVRSFLPEDQLPVNVVLRKAIAPEALLQFANTYQLSVKSYTIVARDTHNQLITIVGAPLDGEMLPLEILKQMMAGVEEQQHIQMTLEGIVSIEASIKAAQVEQIAADANVFGVDITPGLALQDLQQQIPELDVAHVQVIAAPLYWVVATR